MLKRAPIVLLLIALAFVAAMAAPSERADQGSSTAGWSLVSIDDAQAHSVGWPIHKALCFAVGKKCVDKPPPAKPLRPDPKKCRKKTDIGKVEETWDPRIRKTIRWICTKTDRPGGGYIWVRLPVSHDDDAHFWLSQPTRALFDWHRACRSIVCEDVLVWHPRSHGYRLWRYRLTGAALEVVLATLRARPTKEAS